TNESQKQLWQVGLFDFDEALRPHHVRGDEGQEASGQNENDQTHDRPELHAPAGEVVDLTLDFVGPCQHGRVFLPDFRHRLPFRDDTLRLSFWIGCKGFWGRSPLKATWKGYVGKVVVRRSLESPNPHCQGP